METIHVFAEKLIRDFSSATGNEKETLDVCLLHIDKILDFIDNEGMYIYLERNNLMRNYYQKVRLQVIDMLELTQAGGV